MERITQRIGRYFNRPTQWDHHCQPAALAKRLAEKERTSSPPGRPLVCDIGAGRGQHLAFTLNAGNNVLALDQDPTLETKLREVVPRDTQLPAVDTAESAVAVMTNSPVKMAAFKRFDATTDPLPKHFADGVMLHRIYSVLPLASKAPLLEKIRDSLKPGGLFSFLDFLIDPNPAKQLHYHLSRIMAEQGLLLAHGNFSNIREDDPDFRIMAVVLKKDGSPHYIHSEREIRATRQLLATGEVVIPFVSYHQSAASYRASLTQAGFRPLETVDLSIMGYSKKASVPLINIIAETC